MPKQIFTSPHKKSDSNLDSKLESRQVLANVRGLRWGNFTGSPQLHKPHMVDKMKLTMKVSKLVVNHENNMFHGLPDKCLLMRSPNSKTDDLVLWSEDDGIVRMKSLKNAYQPTRKLFHFASNDPVTACGTHLKYSNLWFGHESGSISVYVRTDKMKRTKPTKQKNSRSFNDALEAIIGIRDVNADSETEEDESPFVSKWNFPIFLLKHRGQVLDLKVCAEFKVVVSIGFDGRTVIWDAQKIEYIRTIEASCNTLRSELTIVDVSPTLGDILTVFTPRTGDKVTEDDSLELTDGDDFINVSMAVSGKSQLRLHTINAKYIKHAFTDGYVSSVCFSTMKEGTGVNVIAVGFADGNIRLYSTWTLEMIQEIATGISCLISKVVFTTHQHLAILASDEIQVWESKGLTGESPKFHSIVLQ